MIDTRTKVCYDNKNNRQAHTSASQTKEVYMAGAPKKPGAPTTTIKGGYADEVYFISQYIAGDKAFKQKNKIKDYSTSDPNKVFSVGGVVPPIIECRHNPSKGYDMITLQAEGFDPDTLAAFDALVAAGTIPDLSVDRTDPAKPVIKFPVETITLTESKDGRGFSLTAGTGANTITVEVGAREISVKSSSGIDKTITHSTPDKTYNLDLSRDLIENCFIGSDPNRVIQTIDDMTGIPRQIEKLADLSPELAAALAQTAKPPAAGEIYGKMIYPIKNGELEFLTGYGIESFDGSGKKITHNVILVKEKIGTPSVETTYVLNKGKFEPVTATNFVYGENRGRIGSSYDVNDLGICFNLGSGKKTVELPLYIPRQGTGFKRGAERNFLDVVIDFTQLGIMPHTGLKNPKSIGGPAKYREIPISFSDPSSTRTIVSSVTSTSTAIDAEATEITPPPTEASTGGSDGPSEPEEPEKTDPPKNDEEKKKDDPLKGVTTTKKISGLDKIVKAVGQLGLITGFFLFVGGVLMPALLPAALAVLAVGAGTYLGSNLIADNYDLTLGKIVSDQVARDAKRTKEQKKFAKLDMQLSRVQSAIKTLEGVSKQLSVLNINNKDLTALEQDEKDYQFLKNRVARKAELEADNNRLAELNRLDTKYQNWITTPPTDPNDVAEFNQLAATKAERDAEIANLNASNAARNTEIADIDTSLSNPRDNARFRNLDLAAADRTGRIDDLKKLKDLEAENAELANLNAEVSALALLEADETKYQNWITTPPTDPNDIAEFNRLKDPTIMADRINRINDLKKEPDATNRSNRINALNNSATERAETIARINDQTTGRANEIARLTGVIRNANPSLAALRAKEIELKEKIYPILAEADGKSILEIKRAKGEQAAKDKETELRASFDAAHATPDEIRAFNETLKTEKEAARVAAEKDFIHDNSYSIARNVLVNARDKKTKKLIAGLTKDERAYILDAADEIDTAAAAMNYSNGKFGKDVANPTGKRATEKAAKIKTKLNLRDGSGKSHANKWLNKFVKDYEALEDIEAALIAAGASEDKMKEFYAVRELKDIESGKDRDAKKWEETADADAKKKIDARRTKAGVTDLAMDDPHMFFDV